MKVALFTLRLLRAAVLSPRRVILIRLEMYELSQNGFKMSRKLIIVCQKFHTLSRFALDASGQGFWRVYLVGLLRRLQAFWILWCLLLVGKGFGAACTMSILASFFCAELFLRTVRRVYLAIQLGYAIKHTHWNDCFFLCFRGPIYLLPSTP